MNKFLTFTFLRCLQIALILGVFFTTFPVTQKALENPFQAKETQPVAQGDSLIVHEWGTFTSIAGENGAALEWRPLNGASDLPGFVYQIQNLEQKGLRHNYQQKRSMEAFIRMETPVLYFYTDREMEVSAKVDFPSGKITEWYPQARYVSTGIDWGRFKVLPNAEVALPLENSDSHYYPARETDAAIVRVCGIKETQHEKFLFYRGVGNFNPPLNARLNGEQLMVKNSGSEKIARAIVFENRNGNIGYKVLNLVGDEANLALSSPLSGIPQKQNSIEQELENLLLAEGLYEKEVKAMIKTWRSSWFEEGLRVFYILPRKTTDEVLPIQIEPQPKELVRALVCRTEIITPEMEERLQASVLKLQSSSAQERQEASRAINQYGRFAEPILKRLLKKTTDTSLQTQITQLMKTSKR
jgi:hypothetical protein